MAEGSDGYHMFIYNLPYLERKKLCLILDMNDKWEELGGAYMKFDSPTLNYIRSAVQRNQSPSDELLSHWGTQNHTVLELFVLLSKMQHYQAMLQIKHLVNPKFHPLIFEGEGNLSSILNENKPSGSTPNREDNRVHDEKNLGFEGNINLPGPSMQKSMLDKYPKVSEVEKKIQNNECTPKPVVPSAPKPSSDMMSATFESLSPAIDYDELEIATCGWDRKNLLGKGGFGTVYKGIWKNTKVAIKRLEVQRGGDIEDLLKTQREQSLRELKYLNSCRHDNILPLYGYSIGGPYDCLVYQYMSNGSLEDRLLCREGTQPLSWSQRHSIATGTARGLQFLHTIRGKPLIHGDIKSANILLGPSYMPKIGDFGLAREGPVEQYTHVKVSRVHGTRPYLPDEFLRAKKFSTKVDTYSFGVVLFELATGLRAYDDSRQLKFLKDFMISIPDCKLEEYCDQRAGLEDKLFCIPLISLGKKCVSTKPKERPEMVHVLKSLNAMIVTRDVCQNKPMREYLQQNSLPPPSPYELQVIHDHLSQQRRLSFPPTGNRAVPGVGLNLACGLGSIPREGLSSQAQNKVRLENPPLPSSQVGGESPSIRVHPPTVSHLTEVVPSILRMDCQTASDEIPLLTELLGNDLKSE